MMTISVRFLVATPSFLVSKNINNASSCAPVENIAACHFNFNVNNICIEIIRRINFIELFDIK